MNNAWRPIAAVSTMLLLGGCVAAAILPMFAASTALSGFSLFKVVQTSTGGSIEVAVNDTKLTAEQRVRLKNIRSMAVWPDKEGRGSVVFAETLQESGRFEVVTPSQVAATLKKLSVSDDVLQLTAAEAKATFFKVCQETNTDSLVAGRPVGGKSEMNIWSFDRANQSHEFLITIYDRNGNNYVAELPVTVKLLVGGTIPSSTEISTVVNTEVARAIVALAQNPALQAVPVRQPPDQTPSDKPKESLPSASDQATAPKRMTTKEIQTRLIALGYKPGMPDGVMGKRTADALKAFQRKSGITATGEIDDATLRKLQAN